MAEVFKPPMVVPTVAGKIKVFLAGTIDMGASADWQAEFAEMVNSIDNLMILNPRRDDWDSSWEQSIDNPEFNGQVNWELDGIESAHLVIVYLAPGSKSPITLAELGIVAAMDPSKAIVCCPEGYWRKGNVDVICQRYGITQVESLYDLARALVAAI